MSWYIASGNNKKGPYTTAEINAFISSGAIMDTTLVWHDGMADWAPASNHFSFASSNTATVTASPPNRSAYRIAAKARAAKRAKRAQTDKQSVSDEEQAILQLIQEGGIYVYYTYTISIIIMTFTRTSKVKFIPPGTSRILPGLPYALISLLVGWWGIPFGLILTPIALIKTLAGGTDVTSEVAGYNLMHQNNISETKNTTNVIIASIGVIGLMAGFIYWLLNS